ncbi:hypothetical protein L1987_50846 [Smallanthus sonchifolius]|uniref:Uncharacterized protein n=1 Tax=Smallanthus sonchifolius TaxID=185202 RepID=A0ACB9EPT8_9ASTR|nr:hypothetical protein L1987_50846 [Smallanthus sonchifolius]
MEVAVPKLMLFTLTVEALFLAVAFRLTSPLKMVAQASTKVNLLHRSKTLTDRRSVGVTAEVIGIEGLQSLLISLLFSVDSWVSNAVASLTSVVKQYHLDGIDIDYEHFHATPDIFAQCIGRVVTILKNSRVISFASIAPYEDGDVQRHYMALWRSYGRVFDYVNFQFYAYDRSTTVAQFLSYFERQSANYNGGRVLVSFSTDSSGGLKPENGFFTACERLRSQRKLNGIFVWSADNSKANGFTYERQAQALLAKA